MAEPFLSEIRIMSFGYAPRGWAMANGQLLPINQNQGLFSLLGTTYGGNGQTNFALPNLQGNTPIHVGQGHVLGEKGGSQSVTLSVAQIPTHVHVMQASSTAGDQHAPGGNLLGDSGSVQVYGPPGSLTTLLPSTIGSIGGSQAHLNMQPFLTLNFCIALQGIFPSPN